MGAEFKRFHVFTPAGFNASKAHRGAGEVLVGDGVMNRDGSISVSLIKGSAHLLFASGAGKLKLTEKVDAGSVTERQARHIPGVKNSTGFVLPQTHRLDPLEALAELADAFGLDDRSGFTAEQRQALAAAEGIVAAARMHKAGGAL